MATKWIHSKTGIKLLITISLIFMLSTSYLIYMADWLTIGLHESYEFGNKICKEGMKNNSPDSKIEKLTIKFITITLLFLLCLIVIAIIFLINPLTNLDNATLALEDPDFLIDDDDFFDDDFDEEEPEENFFEEDLLINRRLDYKEEVEEDLIKQIDFLEEDEESVAHSYNKMFDLLQRINDLEKEHSIELTKANEQLQKEIGERKRAEREIRYLSNQLINSHEEARKNLAQDLHDEFGQTLAALHLNAEALLNTMPEELSEHKISINDLINLIEHLGDKIRSISSDLRPDLLDDLGLIPTLQWYIKEFTEKRDDIKIGFQSVGFRKRLTAELELVLYRVFQEGLNNIVKHSKADQVSVTLTYSFPNVIFILKDNGVGFETSNNTSGIGLLGMRERVISVDGSINIVSGKEKGTTIRVEVPVTKES